jgi:hypothetical protein
MRLLLSAWLFLPALAATAQDFDVRTVDLDLADNPGGGTVELSVPQGVTFQVRVSNMVPLLLYQFEALSESFDGRRGTLSENEAATGPCGGALEELRNQLSLARSEAEVRDILRRRRGRAEEVCDDDRMAEVDSWTTVTLPVRVLAPGGRFSFEVRRRISWRLTVFAGSDIVPSDRLSR